MRKYSVQLPHWRLEFRPDELTMWVFDSPWGDIRITARSAWHVIDVSLSVYRELAADPDQEKVAPLKEFHRSILNHYGVECS